MINCNLLSDYVLKKYHISLNILKQIVIESRMTDEQILKWHIPAIPSGGGSTQPELVFRYAKEEKDTMSDVLSRNQAWELQQMLGDNWRSNALDLRNKTYITVYRASLFPIIPGSYVTESRNYASFHREYVNAPEYRIYSLTVPLVSLIWMGDPHEFIYAPTLEEWKSVATQRVTKFPILLQNDVLKC